MALGACAGQTGGLGDGSADLQLDSALGNYLAARHAERIRDFTGAARYFSEALAREPENFELLTRAHTFLIDAGEFSRAVAVAERILRLNPASPSASLTLVVDAARRGDFAAARQRMEGQPLAGVNRLVVPLMTAWLELGQSRPAAALNALRPVGEVSGFKPLYEYHAALINDLADRLDAAEAHYRRSLEIEGGPPARLVEAAGGFLERRGQADAARAVYALYTAQNPDSATIGASLTRLGNGSAPMRLVPDVKAGLAEALFNLAGALRQENSNSLALVYGRLAMALVPDLWAAVIQVADVLESQGQRT
ncbi:MAG: hypothetical protein HY057_08950, partial [Rhodospirillales bacterium]|nr:hypothetical protein [Rhodospirillales bacterium]